MPGPTGDVIARVLSAALDGDPKPAALAFAERPWLRRDLMKALLGAPADAPIAAVFALVWHDVAVGISPDLLPALRWYLQAEAPGRLPARAAVQREVLTRVLALPDLPPTEAGFDLGFSAVRAALDRPAPLKLLALANAALDRSARAWEADPARLPGPGMLYSAQGLLRTDLVRRWLDRLAHARPFAADLQRAIDGALDQMIEFRAEPDPWLTAWILADHAHDPAAPGPARRRAWLALQRDEGLAWVDALLRAMRTGAAEPQVVPALKFAYWTAWTHEMNDLAAWASGLLDGIDPGWRQQADLRGPTGPTEQAEERLDTAGAGLDAVIRSGLALVESDLGLGRPPSPPALRQAFRDLAIAAEAAPVPDGWMLGQIADAAHKFRHLTNREFAWAAHFPDAPHSSGAPQYGLADLQKVRAMDAGLLDLSVALCRAGLAWAEAGHEMRGLWALARIVQIHTDCAIRLGRFDGAAAVLDRLAATGLLPEVLAVAADTLRLACGTADDAAHPPPSPRAGTAVHPFLDRDAWSAAEGVSWQILARDPEIPGRFGVIWPDGRREVYPHATHARTLRLARVPGAQVLAEGLVFGPAGHVLRPDPYHTSRDYPRQSTVVVAGQRAQVRLRPAGRSEMRQPVLLLEACAALFWPNYFHWMIPHLSRIALALEQGLLDSRVLVLPEGLRPWMLESLDLIGLPQDRRLFVPTDRLTRFSDAMLLGSIEHPSAATLAALRRRVLGPGAEAKAPPPDGPFYFLSRRTRNLRKMLNEDEIEAIAVAMGFELIVPETLSVAEQARAFATACGVAGPEGAALTNTLFSAPRHPGPGHRLRQRHAAGVQRPVACHGARTHETGGAGHRFGRRHPVPAGLCRRPRAGPALRWVIEGR